MSLFHGPRRLARYDAQGQLIADELPTAAYCRGTVGTRRSPSDSVFLDGVSVKTNLVAIGGSRATYYRWLKRVEQAGLSGLASGSRQPRRRRTCEWTKQQAQQVLPLRKRYPLWGKRKLWRMLVREQGGRLSESTVGRIVAKLVRLGRVEPVAFYYGQVKPKRRRQFNHPAKRWRYGMKATAPGELMPADPMSIDVSEGGGVKEFKATCPVTGWRGLRA